MNYEIFVNNESTGQCVFNSDSEESAKKVWRHFNGTDCTLKEVDVTPPSMFQNCKFQNCILDIAK